MSDLVLASMCEATKQPKLLITNRKVGVRTCILVIVSKNWNAINGMQTTSIPMSIKFEHNVIVMNSCFGLVIHLSNTRQFLFLWSRWKRLVWGIEKIKLLMNFKLYVCIDSIRPLWQLIRMANTLSFTLPVLCFMLINAIVV